MATFRKELAAEIRSPVPWIVWLTVALVTSIVGPFGSYGAMDVSARVLFWTPVVALALVAATLVRAFVVAGLGLTLHLKGSAVAAALNALVIAPPLYLLMNEVLPPPLRGMVSGAEIVLLIVTISLGVCALRSSAEPQQPVQPQPQKTAPRLMRRLDPALRGEIWAITVRDHYVDVQTSAGKSSLLMRFSDAVSEVDCLPGAQVHRSHWVAWAGVGSVCREGGKMILHLKNGHQIPVSRNNRDKVDARFPQLPPPAPGETRAA